MIGEENVEYWEIPKMRKVFKDEGLLMGKKSDEK